jgi:hypothetical protein
MGLAEKHFKCSGNKLEVSTHLLSRAESLRIGVFIFKERLALSSKP